MIHALAAQNLPPYGIGMLHYQFVPDGENVIIPKRLRTFRALVLIERPTENAFRQDVSRLLVDEGCLYMMAWGQDCTLWDDSVDWAVLEKFDYDVPDQNFVMTTWHDEDTLEEVLRYAKVDATQSYTDAKLEDLLILDFGTEARGAAIEALYEAVE